MSSDLDNFFTPRSVAVVGASADEDKVGHALLRNLLYGSMHGDPDRTMGATCRHRLTSIPNITWGRGR